MLTTSFNTEKWYRKYTLANYYLKRERIPFPYTQCLTDTIDEFGKCVEFFQSGVCNKLKEMTSDDCQSCDTTFRQGVC